MFSGFPPPCGRSCQVCFLLFKDLGSTSAKKEPTNCGYISYLESFSFSALRRLASCAFSAIHLVTSSWFSSEVFLSFSSKAVKVICRASYSSFRVWLALSRSCSLLRSSWHSVSRSEIVCKHSAILKTGKKWHFTGAPLGARGPGQVLELSELGHQQWPQPSHQAPCRRLHCYYTLLSRAQSQWFTEQTH